MTPARPPGRPVRILAATALALAALAAANYALARRAERRNPPQGRFLTVRGVRLHYLERGAGPDVVLLHGAGAMARDFVLSGIFDDLAADHRVIAFDRPGYGFSERPRRRVWTPAAQGDLLWEALRELGVERPVLVGHSWGTLVALAMALRDPAGPTGLALVSGYYYPTARAEPALLSWPAMPVLGDLMRYTVLPWLGRIIAPAVYRRLFAPAPVSPRFARQFPLGLAVRPWQLRAAAAEVALLIPTAACMARDWAGLPVPAAIVAGTGDRVIDAAQSARLSRDLPRATLHRIPAAGHMVHHTEPGKIASVIREIAAAT